MHRGRARGVGRTHGAHINSDHSNTFTLVMRSHRTRMAVLELRISECHRGRHVDGVYVNVVGLDGHQSHGHVEMGWLLGLCRHTWTGTGTGTGTDGWWVIWRWFR